MNTEKKYLKTTEVVTNDNYPYGRLRCTKTWALEWKQGKGFRLVEQTINPKNGVTNAPKKSTYYPVLLLTDTNGFIETAHCPNFNGEKEMNEGAKFMHEHFDCFTPEQVEDIYIHALAMMKVNAYAICQYRGVEPDALKKVIQPAIDALVKGIKSKGTENTWADVKLDKEAIEALGKKDYSPLITVGHHNATSSYPENA